MSRSYRQKMGGAALRTLLSLAMLISMMMPQAFFAAFALADDEVTYSLESDHNYANSMDETKTFTCEGATNGVYVTFNDSTKVESGYDYIYIYDGDDNLIGTYTGTTLAGVTIYVPTATVKIRLTSDSSSVYYGYACTITAAGEALDLSLVGTLASVAPVALGASIEPEVTVGSTVLTAGTDYTFEASSATVGTQTITVTGIGSYTGTLSSTFTVYDPDDESTWATGATITSSQRSLRMSSDTGTTYVGLGSATDAWKAAITSITIEPIESDGSATVVEGAEYPNAPQKMTLTSDDFYFSGSYLYFNRTESNPIIYVMSGHEPLSITKWGTTCTYNSQTYQITIEATGYTTTVGTNTWYTGTSDTFSIIIDEDGDDSTTADQTTAATWTRAQLEEKVSFANGSSQCGMTGFRTFSTEGVSLTSLLSEAGVTVDETDYFLLDTTDHYGNNFTYEELFGTTRYFMSAVYEEGFAETYASIVETDSAAGSTIELRKYLAEKAAANESTIEPRICTSYVETYVYASDVADAVLPTEENTTFNSLVAYENQYRFVYGIALVQEECTLTFDTNGGSEVESQTVLSHLMTSTANTTMWSSYWANSLVIYRGAGTTTSSESTAAEAIEVPENPTKEGYVFAGWYTDEDCTDGNEFDFEANDATIDVDTTLYAKWIEVSIAESDHNYANSIDESKEVAIAGATNGLYITFSDETKVESSYDYIYIYDANGTQVGKYTGTTLAGATIYVATSSATIRLTSDSSTVYYGYYATATAAGSTVSLETYGSVSVPNTEKGADVTATVTIGGKTLVEGTDYTVTGLDSSTAGTQTVTVTGSDAYPGTLTTTFYVYDDENKMDAPALYSVTRSSLRMSSDSGTTYMRFNETIGDTAWSEAITSITLTPIEEDGTETVIEGAEYPNAPTSMTLTSDQFYASGKYLYFSRTAEDPIIYVMRGRNSLDITSYGTTCTYSSQLYKVTIEAAGYETIETNWTWYIGSADDFSIIIDEDGDTSTTADRTTAATWTVDELTAMSTFANGSSQCGMTGFRTFSSNGVELTTLLELAEVEVDESDYFLIDTTDQYGNYFTYANLFGATRYFMSAVYDEGFSEIYQSIVETDSAAGSTIELRKYLAEQALANESTVEPRICPTYTETYVYASDLADAELPTAENTSINSLVAYENQYRFVYGIKLVQEECTLTFDTNGGSEVESQTVLSHIMTSTENTTSRSSYWVNSLVIFRGAGEAYLTEESTAAEAIEVPETPTKEGYVFAGWYTDEDCTDGNEFDFEANDATIDVDTTLYAKWITASDVELTNFSMSSEEHDDADEELNQIIYIDLEFSDEISLTEDFDAAEDLYITIAGGDVANTAREVTASVVNGNTLRVKLCSTAWVAIYAGALTISQTESGMNHIVDSEGLPVVFDTQSGRIPIGIVVENYATAGTSDTAATTICNVAHKANMRGMYAYILVSIDAEGNETVIQSSTSHAHNFYSTITRESIASTMASGIDAIDGYSATYYEDTSVFVITADEAVEGETLAIRMDQVNSEVVYGTVSEAAVASFNMSNEEHDDADAELNQIIYIDVEFDQDITLSEDFDAAQDLYITIAGGDVANTAREVTASVVNGNTLRVKLCSTAWVAIYAGALTISQTDLCVGAGHIQDANGNTVVFDTQSGRIPIGIVVENYATAGTSDTAATTICNVAHKANMRGMFAYILVSIDAEGNETVIQSSTSHAHNFYTTITRESIASTMASGIDAIDGYSATYYEDSSVFVITADEAVEGETLAIRMDQVNSEVVYGTVSEAAVANFSMSSEEHDDADAELNQIIYIDVEFDQDITLSEDFDAAQDLYITIAGGDVANTAREVTASVVNGNTLRVKLCSTAWVAIYAGALTISQTDLCVGAGHIQDANGNRVVFDTQSGRIPIGIVVSNDATAGTASVAASTIVNVEHKANMRGMYAFILVSIDAEGNETIIKSSTSHAHNFYSSITKEYIASVMASAIDSIDGYSTQYIEGTTYFVMTADEAVEGQTIAIRMDELGSAVNYTTGSAASMAAAAQEAIDALEAEIADLEEEIAGLEAELAELEGAAEAYEAEIAELEEAVEAYEAEIADLEAKVAELEASGTADATTIATLKSTIESLESTVADYKSTIESLESTAATYKSMVDSLNSTISSMTTAAEAYTATIANLSASVSSLNTTIAEKEAEITALKAEIAELEASATADATTIATLKSTVSSLESAVEGYKTTISEQTTEISKLESQISTLKSEAETSSSTITSLKAQVASLESTITEMTTAATEASSTIASLQAQVATLQSTVESQKTTISTLEDTVSALESQVSDLTASSSEATKAAAAIASLFEDALTINVKSLTSKKAGKATLKWYKNAAADGYQITYKSGGKTKTIKVSYSKAKKVLKKLAKGKKVKVQIRAFAEVNGTTYYGAWSKTVKVKVKK